MGVSKVTRLNLSSMFLLAAFIGVAACNNDAGGGTDNGSTGSGGSDGATGGASTSTGSDGSAGSGGDLPEDPDGVSPAGMVTSIEIGPLPGNGMVAPAWDDQETQIGGGARFQIPRGMYVTSCSPEPGGALRSFLSYSVESGSSEDPPETDPLIQRTWWQGGLAEVSVDGDGTATPVATWDMPECLQMRGIVAAPDCSFVGAFCVRFQGTSTSEPFTRDLVAESDNPDAFFNPSNGGTHPDELWLYEWANADLDTEPKKFVVHKAATSSWHYMDYKLTLIDDNTYAGLTKSYSGGHEGSSLLVVDRQSESFSPRTDSWGGCVGPFGHPLWGYLAYNPTTDALAAHCGGDWDNGDGGDPATPYRGAWIEGEGSEVLYRTVHVPWMMGAPGGIVPLEDGGYMLAFSTVRDDESTAEIFANVDWTVWDGELGSQVRTVAALMRIDGAGNVVWGPQYQSYAEEGDVYGGFLGHTRLSDLGNGRYLFGYGRAKKENPEDPAGREAIGSYNHPFEYVLVEVNGDGEKVSEELVGTDFGWGTLDETETLAPGRVAWPFIPDPAYDLEAGRVPGFEGEPPLNSTADRLAYYVYESAFEP